MGRRYLLSGRVPIVLRTGGGKHITKNILKDHLGLPCPSRRCRADVREMQRWWRSCRLRRSPGPGMTSRWENSDTACESRLSHGGVGELLRSVSIHGYGQKVRRAMKSCPLMTAVFRA
jgi:hypothetical protein